MGYRASRSGAWGGAGPRWFWCGQRWDMARWRKQSAGERSLRF
jgi:hypothetical protein